MKKISINEIEYNVPESYNDITLLDYCTIFFNLKDSKDENDNIDEKIVLKNDITIISRLLNVDEDFIKELPIKVWSRLRDEVKWIYDDSFFHKNKTNLLTIDNIDYHIPQVNKMTLRQWIDVDITSQEKKNPEQFLELLAILLLPISEDKYDGNYQQRKEKLKILPADKALSLLYFFLYKGKILNLITQIYSVAEAHQHQLHQVIQDSSRATIGIT